MNRAHGSHRGHWRGRGRGNNRGRGGSNFIAKPPGGDQPVPLDNDLGDLLEKVQPGQITPVGEEDGKIRDARHIGGFNWLGSVDKPILAIPGAPAKWTPPETAPKLQEDSDTEKYYRDVNAAYSPQYHMHATALAILEADTIPVDDIDIVACAGTLRNLLEFLRDEYKTFRMAVELVGDTVFFVRREASPRQALQNVRGYGHSMPEAYTTWHQSVKGSVSAQRIVGYRFAGMHCLVRYEPDGYLRQHAGNCEASAINEETATSDDLADMLSSAAVSSTPTTGEIDSELEVRAAGFFVPQNSVFELKTRAAGFEHNLFEQFAPSLWLKQIPFFINAFQKQGIFRDIQTIDVRSRVTQWEAENQDVVRKLGGLLRWIVARVRAMPDYKLEFFRSEKGDLAVHHPGAQYAGALPVDIEDRWNAVDGPIKSTDCNPAQRIAQTSNTQVSNQPVSNESLSSQLFSD